MRIEFVVKDCDDGISAGLFLVKNNVSKRLIVKLKRVEKGITCNGVHIKTIDTLKTGDIIVISIDDEKKLDANALLEVPVAYEDDDVIVFDKPFNMPVHPSVKHQGDTLGNYFSYCCRGLTFRPVNRLDKDTSGLCVVAKNAYAAKNLQNSIEKTYYAVVCGDVCEEGCVNAPIAREHDSIIKRCVAPDGQKAITFYTPIGGCGIYTLLRIHLETGRTHQIRVHMAYIGHPLAGDDFYGGSIRDILRQALHCGDVSFVHPVSNQKISLHSRIPRDMFSLVDF